MNFGRRDSSLFVTPPPGEPANGTPSSDSIPVPAARPAPRPQRDPNELNAFLGKGCIYEGKLTFEGRVRIDGKFTGEIFSNDTLEIGPDAEIEAQIDVSTVIVAGTVTGNISARSRCDLRAPAVVVGNVTSPVVTMQEGVRFDGEMRMSGGLDEAVRAKTTRAPTAADPPNPTMNKSRPISAPASRDPSDLLKPVP